MHGGSAEPSLTEIHKKLDKQVSAQKEKINKYFRGSRKLSQANKKCVQ